MLEVSNVLVSAVALFRFQTPVLSRIAKRGWGFKRLLTKRSMVSGLEGVLRLGTLRLHRHFPSSHHPFLRPTFAVLRTAGAARRP